MSLFIKNIFLVQLCLILAILYPTSLANLVVEVGTRHSHQTLFHASHCIRIGVFETKLPGMIRYNGNHVMLILYEMLHTCSIVYTQRRCKFGKIISTDASGCFFTNVTFTAVVLEGNFVKSYHKSIEFNLFFIHLSLF